MNERVIITGILAATTEGAIGLNGKLPWNYPEELQHFKDTIKNNILILGRKTYESMPKSFFENRFCIVLSKSSSTIINNIIFVKSIEECIQKCRELQKKDTPSEIFMIGGSEITSQFLAFNLLSKFILTIVYNYYEGDSYISLGSFKNWHRVKIIKNNNYSIYYLNKP